MTQTAHAVVRRHVVVQAAPEKAFEVFTARFGDCKPPKHNMLAVPIAERRESPSWCWDAS